MMFNKRTMLNTRHLVSSLYKLFFFISFLIFICFNSTGYAVPADTSSSALKWVGTWSTAPQLVETGNNPPSPGLSNSTLRQIVHISLGGDSLRIRFSNEFSTHPVTLYEVHIAASKTASIIDTATDKVLYFNENKEVTLAAGGAVTSDAIHFKLQPLSNVTISIYFGSTSSDVTGHPGSRTTSYLLTGNHTTDSVFTGAVTTDHWYVINTIDVLQPDTAAAVAIVGNSITDGRGSGTNKQNRWPDELSRRFQANPQTKHIAVLNEGIGGNCVLGACLGPSAISRFKRDVLDQSGVKWVIIFEGVNDIGYAGGAAGSANVATKLIAAYQQMIDSAHVHGLIIYGATILPFNGNSYYTADHEKARQTVNDWIRTSGKFDGVVDFDKSIRDPNSPTKLISIADCGDHLHPSENGHKMIAEAVDQTLFGAVLPTGVNDNKLNLPDHFSLSQNYPNPFNPVTIINYSIGTGQLSEAVNVSLKVYDILGREIKTIVNEVKTPGNYSIYFDGTSLSNGVYFYKLQAGNFSQTNKMLLLK